MGRAPERKASATTTGNSNKTVNNRKPNKEDTWVDKQRKSAGREVRKNGIRE